MTPAQLLEEIHAAPTLGAFLDARLFVALPWIFGDEAASFDAWRAAAAKTAGLSPESFVMVGSAAVGYSLSPRKPGRPFRPARGDERPSDIDIAIVAPELFTTAWDMLVYSDRRRTLRRPWEDREKLRRDVYWGTISDFNVLPGTDAARMLRLIGAATSRQPRLLGHPPRIRIYRRREDLREYHENSLRDLVRQLKG